MKKSAEGCPQHGGPVWVCSCLVGVILCKGACESEQSRCQVTCGALCKGCQERDADQRLQACYRDSWGLSEWVGLNLAWRLLSLSGCPLLVTEFLTQTTKKVETFLI